MRRTKGIQVKKKSLQLFSLSIMMTVINLGVRETQTICVTTEQLQNA
jgi:hypothetical protein